MTDLPKHLREQAAIFRSEDALGRGAAPLEQAADLIEQQAKDIAALQSDIEAQIRIASEEATRAAELGSALRQIAAIENQYDGGDWDEIEEARVIARAAIAVAKEHV